MTRVSIPWKGLVLACDGARAVILRNDGFADALNLTTVVVLDEPHPATRDQGSDRPGRLQQRLNGPRSTTADTDWHEEAERAFLQTVAHCMSEITRAEPPPAVVIAAPPKALGILRKAMPQALRELVTGEIQRDFAHLSNAEIEAHLAA